MGAVPSKTLIIFFSAVEIAIFIPYIEVQGLFPMVSFLLLSNQSRLKKHRFSAYTKRNFHKLGH